MLQPGREERRRGRRRREEVETVEAELYLLPTTMCFPRISKLDRDRVWVCTPICWIPMCPSLPLPLPPAHPPLKDTVLSFTRSHLIIRQLITGRNKS